jgi:hypothetical protein
MKRLPFALLLVVASCATVGSQSPTPVPSSPPDDRFSIYIGQRNLDDDDYDPVDKQTTLGLEFAHEPAGSAIGWEVGLMGSGQDDEISGVDVEGRTGEIYGGIRKTFGQGSIRPFVGGGISFIRSKVHVDGLGSEDDTSPAGYFHGGVLFLASETFALGLDLRVLFGSDLDLGGFDTDADYAQLALFLGVGF